GRRGNPRGARGAQMPLRHAHVDPAGDPARGRDDGVPAGRRAGGMKGRDPAIDIARRDLLKGGAALIVALGTPGIFAARPARAGALASARPLDPGQLDTWLAIDGEGRVTGYWGKMDMGQGVDTAIAQIVAEELDVEIGRAHV